MSEEVQKAEDRGQRTEESAIRNPQSAIAHFSPNQKAWRRFRRNRPAMLSLGALLFLAARIITESQRPPR